MALGARLAHTFFVDGDRASSAPSDRRWLLVLHGIYGRGRNWTGFLRRLTAHRPEWGAIAVDLRKHGDSQDAPPPHTVAACAQDLVDLERELGLVIGGVSGHSFGGKVALSYADFRARWGNGALDTVWVLDSDPSAAPDRLTATSNRPGAVEVLRILEAAPSGYATRQEFRAVLAQRGIDKKTSDWLGMNLRRRESGFRLRMDIPALRQLLEDYLRLDFWPLLEDLDAEAIHFVFGGRSPVIAEDLPDRVAALGGRVRVKVHMLPEAGHRVHVDDSDGLLALFEQYLP